MNEKGLRKMGFARERERKKWEWGSSGKKMREEGRKREKRGGVKVAIPVWPV